MLSFVSLAHQLFPRLPDNVVEPGGSWVDTVTWSTTEPIESTSGAVLTFTLVGDTLVDGRTLLNITVASEVTGGAQIDQGGISMTQSIGGHSDRLRALGHRTRAACLPVLREGDGGDDDDTGHGPLRDDDLRACAGLAGELTGAVGDGSYENPDVTLGFGPGVTPISNGAGVLIA